MENEKIFVGNVEKKVMGEGADAWAYFAIGLSERDLATLGQNLNASGFVNLSLKKSSKGNYYIELFQPKKRAQAPITEDRVREVYTPKPTNEKVIEEAFDVKPDEQLISPDELPF